MDLSTLIFVEIFKISPELMAKYTTLGDQLIYLLLVPHIVLFMFLLAFGNWIFAEHAGIKKLAMIAAYIVLVYSGMYGTMIVPVVNAWFMLTLIGAFILFIITRFFSPTKYSQLAALGLQLGKKLREPKDMEEQLERINAVLTSIGVKGLDKNPYKHITAKDLPKEIFHSKDAIVAILPLLEKREEILKKLGY